MQAYEITAEINLKKIIPELREVAQAFNELADNLDQIEKKYAKPQESEEETSYTPTEVRDILVEEGQEHGTKYGLKLGEIIKFSPTEVEQILKAESEE